MYKVISKEHYFFDVFNNLVLLVNTCGEYVFITKNEYRKLNKPNLLSIETKNRLKSRFFLYEESKKNIFDNIYRIKYNTKHSYLENDTLLLMVVPTISCNCSCIYCQVNSKKNKSKENNMSLNSILHFCNFVFALPHKNIKIEFQGGEPTLCFDSIEFIVRRINHLNHKYKKCIDYVICTNLLELKSHEIKVIKKFNIAISTSLDGSRRLHNINRPSVNYSSTFDTFIKNIKNLRKNNVHPSGLVTVTAYNLPYMKEIIDIYINNNFESIFLRPLNNYGCALENKHIYYSLKDYMHAYREAIRYIIDKNIKDKIYFREEMFSIILRKILSPFNDGFVDMQNPCALGQMCMIVKQNGDIYPSDESRMISEMGNEYWKMGNINNSDCLETIKEKRTEILENGKLENYEECKECAYSPFCYADPIKKWYIQNIAGEQYESYCGIRKELFRFVFEQIAKADESKMKLFRRWANV